MNKKSILAVSGAFLVICVLVIGVNQALSCTQGCTPGFWKNHLDMWVGFNPYQTLEEALYDPNYPGWVWPVELIELKDVCLIDALSFKGGRGELGAARIMLRHAVAALLNTAHPNVDHFEKGVDWVKLQIRNALAAYDVDREYLIFKAFWFQTYNELGCPLSRDTEETTESITEPRNRKR